MPAIPSTWLFYALAAAMTVVALAFVLPRLAPPAARDPATGAKIPRERSPAALAVAFALPALAFGLYALLGEPDAATVTADAPVAEAGDATLTPQRRAELVAHLARNPGDGRGLVLLARDDAAAERYADAATAFARALAESPKVAADPGVWCEYADALGMAQGGVLAGKPRELIAHALALDPKHARALEMEGSAAFEAGDYPAAAARWRTLLAQLPTGDPARRELEAAIARLDALAARR